MALQSINCKPAFNENNRTRLNSPERRVWHYKLSECSLYMLIFIISLHHTAWSSWWANFVLQLDLWPRHLNTLNHRPQVVSKGRASASPGQFTSIRLCLKACKRGLHGADCCGSAACVPRALAAACWSCGFSGGVHWQGLDNYPGDTATNLKLCWVRWQQLSPGPPVPVSQIAQLSVTLSSVHMIPDTHTQCSTHIPSACMRNPIPALLPSAPPLLLAQHCRLLLQLQQLFLHCPLPLTSSMRTPLQLLEAAPDAADQLLQLNTTSAPLNTVSIHCLCSVTSSTSCPWRLLLLLALLLVVLLVACSIDGLP